MKAAFDLDVMERGELRVLGHLPRASNSTFLAEVVDGDRAVPVVYKPRAGETPLWDFPPGTLANREVAAFLLADALGWPRVPPTVLREGPMGEGSVQRFVEFDPRQHFFTLREAYPDVFRAVAAFDVVAGNGDRKSGHCLLGTDGTIWAIDHGLCFNTEPWLRTVIWDFAEEPVPDGLLSDLRRVAPELRGGAVRDALLGLLSGQEVDAAAERAEALIGSRVFPPPGPGRALPWPPV